MALRTENIYLDRLHHYLLPQLFVNHIWRTHKLLHYPSEVLFTAGKEARSVCFDYRIRPSLCHDYWVNFRRSCVQHDAECKQVGLLWEHTLQRMRAIQQTYPTMQVDLTLLESQEDLQICRGGFSPTAVRKADVLTIIRVRHCDASTTCSTIYIDEYRYEVGCTHSEAVQWYYIVAWLRRIGQGYYYLRIAMLLVFCYRITPCERQSCRVRVQKAIILFVKTPMQSVIFGSPFPIFCYACAHSIDAATSYELLRTIFTTQGGIFQLKFRDLLTVGFNQMRSVWLLAVVFHVAIAAMTSRTKQSWSPVDGVLGVPEFLLSGLASVTILAQYRSTSFRSTKILSIFQILETSSLQSVRSWHKKTHRGTGNVQLGGIWIDCKFFLSLLLLFWVIFTMRRVILCWMRWRGRMPGEIQTRTPVPYSAGVLWPIGSMCVLWTTDYFCVDPSARNSRLGRMTRRSAPLTRAIPRLNSPPASQSSWGSLASFHNVNVKLTGVMDILPAVLMSPHDFRSIQVQMESLHSRSDDVEATIAFINLVTMSDPIVYLWFIIGGGGKPLGYYQSQVNPEQLFLLPRSIVRSANILEQELRLVHKVRSSTLTLSDLIHCG